MAPKRGGKTSRPGRLRRTEVSRAERHRWIRSQVAAGVDVVTIRRRLASGVTLADGRPMQVTADTARKDLAEVADDLAAVLEEDGIARLEMAASFQRVRRIAVGCGMPDGWTEEDLEREEKDANPEAPAHVRAAAISRRLGLSLQAERLLLEILERTQPARYAKVTGRRIDEQDRGTEVADERLREIRDGSIDDLATEAARGFEILEALGLLEVMGAPE